MTKTKTAVEAAEYAAATAGMRYRAAQGLPESAGVLRLRREAFEDWHAAQAVLRDARLAVVGAELRAKMQAAEDALRAAQAAYVEACMAYEAACAGA